jgi:hypothetical protein
MLSGFWDEQAKVCGMQCTDGAQFLLLNRQTIDPTTLACLL